jgi:predicted nucleic acid-binding protein
VGAVNACADSVIIIDHLNGVPAASECLDAYDAVFVSIISWIEVMAGTSDADRIRTERGLAAFQVLDLSRNIARLAAGIRRERRLKLPDAIILATAGTTTSRS